MPSAEAGEPAAGSSLRADLAAALFVLLLGAVALWQAERIPVSPIYAQVGPRAVPYAIAGLLLLAGFGLTYTALRGGWSWALDAEDEVAPTNWRALTLLAAGLLANVALIVPAGFSIAAAVQFVLVAAAFGSRDLLRDAIIALPLTLLVWFGFVEVLGVNIGAGLAEGVLLEALGRGGEGG